MQGCKQIDDVHYTCKAHKASPINGLEQLKGFEMTCEVTVYLLALQDIPINTLQFYNIRRADADIDAPAFFWQCGTCDLLTLDNTPLFKYISNILNIKGGCVSCL